MSRLLASTPAPIVLGIGKTIKLVVDHRFDVGCALLAVSGGYFIHLATQEGKKLLPAVGDSAKLAEKKGKSRKMLVTGAMVSSSVYLMIIS